MPNPDSLLPTRLTGSGPGALLERGLDSSSGLRFVRERLGLLGKTLFLVSFGFYLFLLASLTLIGGAPFVAVVRGPVALGHLCASLTMALLWLVTSRARLSLRSLGALDAVSFVVAGGFLSLMTITDLHSLATWWDVLTVVKKGGYLQPAQIAEVEKFLHEPAKWSAAHGGVSSFKSG